ncbi:MAG: molybdopterin adenylyltransferase [Bacteroidales bacterium]|nr:molybdopterin adenylyltransferase [Bacteroidales bacterium]MBN2821096.1 molybdopterin adenylyltransferase [Bacteroidales bacterium]
MNLKELKIGILTISDRASQGIYEDKSGPAVKEYFELRIKNKLDFEYRLVGDSFTEIKKQLIDLCDKQNCSIVITTGGTGPAPKDITPEATEAVLGRILPGFGEAMRTESLKYVSTAILSRQIAGIRGASLIINLPGSPKAIAQCLDAVINAIPDCVYLIGGPEIVAQGGDKQIMHV